MLDLTGRGERIRTSDLTVPNRALYQAEPRPDVRWMIGEHGGGVKFAFRILLRRRPYEPSLSLVLRTLDCRFVKQHILRIDFDARWLLR